MGAEEMGKRLVSTVGRPVRGRCVISLGLEVEYDHILRISPEEHTRTSALIFFESGERAISGDFGASENVTALNQFGARGSSTETKVDRYLHEFAFLFSARG